MQPYPRLVESELFGHEKGAFTGALMQKRGRFELADRGTLFLEEIGDISLDLQPKLLRAWQEHEFERLASAKTIQSVDEPLLPGKRLVCPHRGTAHRSGTDGSELPFNTKL